MLDYIDEKIQPRISEEEAVKFSEVTHFTVGEIYLIYELYHFFIKTYCITEDSQVIIEHDEFLRRVPMFWMLPYKDRLMRVFSPNKEYINFGEFLRIMSALSHDTPQSMKFEVMFNLYDFDEDGLISHQDLVELFKRLTKPEALRERDYNVAADNVLKQCDKNEDGFLDLNEFKELMQHTDELNLFHLPMTKRCPYRLEDLFAVIAATEPELPFDNLIRKIC